MKVSLKDDRMPDGTELYVRGLGVLVNGASVEFSDEQIAVFEDQRGLSLEEAFANDKRVMVGKASKQPPAPIEEEEEDESEDEKGGDD